MARNQKAKAPSPGQPLNGQGVLRISRLSIVNSELKLATWNVRSLFAAGKLDNTEKEMKRMHIDILGISELRWKGTGILNRQHTTLYYSGSDMNDAHHRSGVGILLKNEFTKYVTNFAPISDRLLLIQLNSSPFKTNIIQIYAPTADKKYDNEVELLYEQIGNVLKSLKKDEVTYIIGDFNSKIGQGRRGDIAGPYGLGHSNDRGDRLYDFCVENDMIITNTWFKLPKRRLYTWKSPNDDPLNPNSTRNQIDYILINKRFRNIVKRVTTYPGADVGSDHNPLLANIKMRLKKPQGQKKQRKLIDYHNLNNNKDQISETLNNNLYNITEDDERPEDLWNNLKHNLIKAITDHTHKNKTSKRKIWMTEEILDLMERRRIAKGNTQEYRQLQQRIKKEIRLAKEKWMREQCEEMESMMTRHDSFNVHRKIREISGIFRRHVPPMLTDNNNRLILDEEEIIKTWEHYIVELFGDDRNPGIAIENCEEGPEILKVEVQYALKNAKTRKTPGPDEIPVELLKMMNEDNIHLLIRLFNKIYDTGEIPIDWLESTFIAIPKKQKARKCSDHRLISLMSHTLKVFLRIVHNRIKNKCEQDLEETQFGFRNSFGTREALFALNILLQKCRDQRKDVFACFVDFEKAFDKVKHTELINILQKIGVDTKDIRIIRNLYWNQNARVKIGDRLTNRLDIQRGVRQGCILSPTLFNLYSDQIFKTALEDQPHGIKINGELLNVIRYADDTVIVSDTVEGLQELLNRIDVAGNAMGININVQKTKFMVFSRAEHPDAVLHLNTQPVQRVDKFVYLGSIITDQLDPDPEIKRRIAMARTSFTKMRSFFTNDNINLKLRQRMAKCYVWSVLLYSAETWTLKISTMNKIEALEMWIHRRILKIPWVARQTNEQVLERARVERELLTTIKIRKLSYLGHILRGQKYRVLQLILKGKIEGRRGIGRKQASWMKNIREWTGIRNAGELFHLAENRERFAVVIANVRGT